MILRQPAALAGKINVIQGHIMKAVENFYIKPVDE